MMIHSLQNIVTVSMKTLLILKIKPRAMIQRVQSVYLLLVTIVMSFFIVRPYAEVTLNDGQKLLFHAYTIRPEPYDSESSSKTTAPVIALVIICGLTSFATIFLYSRRDLQLKFCILNIIMLAALLSAMFIYYSATKEPAEVVQHTFRIPAIYPLMAIMLNFMAYKAIRHDSMIVKSYERIR
jgi:hypothetical protein